MTNLATLKALLAAATQGEWRRQDNPDFAEIWAPGGRQPVALVARAEDADAIVAAHNMMPGLIAEVERLREAVAAAEAAGEARGLERAAKAVIRLVAEACCEAVTWMPGTISQLPLFQDGFKHGRACAVATIRSTFLLPEARDGEAD